MGSELAMNRDEALSANRKGAIAACISGAATTIVVLAAMTSDSDGAYSFWSDPIYLIDAVLIFLCAYGMYKNSRTASVFIFFHFLLSKLSIFLETGSIPGLLISIIFLYFYGKAIKGSFAFHRIEKEENPEHKPAPKWLIFSGIPVIAILFGSVIFGLLTMTSILPSTEVLHQSQIPKQDIEKLKRNGVLHEDDNVDYFYSYGLRSILEGGNLLTDDRVIIYFTDEKGDILIYEMYFEEISSIEALQTGGFLSNSLYRVNGVTDDYWLLLELSTEKKGDERFVRTLKDRAGLP